MGVADMEVDKTVLGLLGKLKARENMALFAIVFSGFAFRVLIYTRYPYSYGIDGPYYNLQVQSILQTGWLYQDDTPFIFYFFTLWSLLLGDVTLGIKVGISVLSSLMAVPVFLLTKRAIKDWKSGAVAAFLSLFNPLHMQLLDNLLKNTAGILFLLCFLYLFLKTCDKSKPINYVVSFLFLLLTFLTHIHPSGLAVLFILGYILFIWITEKKLPEAEIRVSTILFVSLLIGLLIVVVSVPGALTKFSKVLSFISSFGEETVESFPILEVRQNILLFSIPLVLGLTYLLQDVWKKSQGKEKLLFLSILLMCFFLSLPFIPQNWSRRFAMINFVPLALFTGYGLGKAEKDLPRIVIIGLVIVILFSSLFETWLFSQRMGPIINEAGIKELEELKDKVPENSVIIVHGRVFYWVQLITSLKTFHGVQNPIQLHQEYGGPIYGLIEKSEFPPPPNIGKYIILEDGPYIIFLIYPR